ncbi:unnamed protein product [Lactuca virosa]|uniref:Strictosidine synthase conserved region domain-containing protein n=1 Tax=Lactuca virosa TaxID=75947 RepID=A0AAU9M0D6_9ASTR|nr:unnamed protein product [Lactuca virosa]
MASPRLVFIFIILAYVFGISVSSDFTNCKKLVLPLGVTGPESATFIGHLVNGLFTPVTDGRIMRWKGHTVGFVDFAYTSPKRTKKLCDNTTNLDLGPICGRPIALSFNPYTGLLYIADAYRGLLVVGLSGGLANQLVGGLKFAGGLDVDLLTGDVYFSDASLTFNLINTTQIGFKPDSTGRLLRYNPRTGHVSVLLSGVSGGGGPAVSSDGTFVLVPEFLGKRILKYWLVGPKANTAEVLLNVVGNPNQIKRAGKLGEFWVAVSVGYVPLMPLIKPQGVRFNSNGVVLQTISFAREFFNRSISLVQEQDGKLYVGSRSTNFIGVYCKTSV